MIATIANVILVLIGSTVGLLFQNLISEKLLTALTNALALCVLGIGISSLIGTQDMLCVIVCMVVGTILGNALSIDDRLDGLRDFLRTRLIHESGNSRFTEGFVNAFLLFCVGAMSITGSIEAGLNHNYEIILSKGVIDGVSAVSFAATMGIGVVFSTVPLLIYQGGITLLAAFAGNYIPTPVITEMTAVGGALIVSLAINMMGLGKERLKVANMLPAMFLPIAYIPLASFLSSALSSLTGLFG